MHPRCWPSIIRKCVVFESITKLIASQMGAGCKDKERRVEYFQNATTHFNRAEQLNIHDDVCLIFPSIFRESCAFQLTIVGRGWLKIWKEADYSSALKLFEIPLTSIPDYIPALLGRDEYRHINFHASYEY